MAESNDTGQLLRVADAARRTFGNRDFAYRWLNAANPALNGQVPIAMAATEAGAREVEALLSRIANGDYS